MGEYYAMAARRAHGSIHKNDLVCRFWFIGRISLRDRFICWHKTGATSLQPCSTHPLIKALGDRMDVTHSNNVAPQTNERPRAMTSRRKVLLLDDDPVFRGVMIALAKSRNIEIDAYESLQELDTFLQIESYNGIILDHHLAERLASEDICGLDAFFASRPVLLVSADERARDALNTQPAFRKFVPKVDGPQKILDELEALMIEKKENATALH